MFTSTKKKSLLKKIIPAAACIAVAAAAGVYFFGAAPLDGTWELVDIRATQARIDSIPDTQRAALEQELSQQLATEAIKLQINKDGTGIMTISASWDIENHNFTWTTENGILRQRIGIISQNYEYTVSRSTLILTNHEDNGGTIWEFRRASS